MSYHSQSFRSQSPGRYRDHYHRTGTHVAIGGTPHQQPLWASDRLAVGAGDYNTRSSLNVEDLQRDVADLKTQFLALKTEMDELKPKVESIIDMLQTLRDLKAAGIVVDDDDDDDDVSGDEQQPPPAKASKINDVD